MRFAKTKLFYSFKLTSMDKHAEPVSLGITSSNGEYFYAEFTDTDVSQYNSAYLEDKLILQGLEDGQDVILGDYTQVRGNKEVVRKNLLKWLKQFKYVEFWGDCIWFDGLILDELLGGVFSLPDNVNPTMFDIATVFKIRGIDFSIDREVFIDTPIEGKKTALYYSQVIEASYNKLYRNGDSYGFMV